MRGEHRQTTLKLGAATRGTLRRFAAAHEQLEFLVALLTGVLE
jgi:hypothetical protein